jgi:hypothetical protein
MRFETGPFNVEVGDRRFASRDCSRHTHTPLDAEPI